MLRRRLNLRQKHLAVDVARDAREKAGNDESLFKELVKADPRTVGIDPALIVLFIQVALAVFRWFQNRQTTPTVDAADNNAVYLASIRYLPK